MNDTAEAFLRSFLERWILDLQYDRPYLPELHCPSKQSSTDQ